MLTAFLALVPGGSASALRERPLAQPLTALSIAGTDVGYADEYKRGCHQVRRWSVSSRADVRVASHCFAATSTGSGVADIATTHDRVLWLTFTGGNIREWSLWTKGGAAFAKRIAFKAADVDGPAPIVVGRAQEDSLPFAVGRTIVVLAADGSRKLSLEAPDRVVTLTANTRGYAAVLADGSVLRISLTARILGRTQFEPGFAQEALLAAPGLIVKTIEGLEIHRDGIVRRMSLPAGSRFLGYSEHILAYASGRQLRLRRIPGGKDVFFRTLAPGFRAQMGRNGVVYASGRTLGYAARVLVSSAMNG
jgi:hypothetical protein